MWIVDENNVIHELRGFQVVRYRAGQALEVYRRFGNVFVGLGAMAWLIVAVIFNYQWPWG